MFKKQPCWYFLILTLLACSGSVDLPSSSTSTTSNSTSDTTSTNSTSSVSSSNSGTGGSSQGGGGQGGLGGGEPETLLGVQKDEAVVVTVRACESGSIGFAYTLKPQDHPLKIQGQHLRFESTDGGFIRGSAGTPYFILMRLADADSMYVYSGPMDIDPTLPFNTTTTTIHFKEVFEINPNKEVHIVFTFDSVCTEDAPGEFIGHTYRLIWEPMTAADAWDMTTNLPLDPASIKPNTEIVGDPFSITP